MPSSDTLRVLMATRRSDDQARRSWLACIETVRSSRALTAVLIDRTKQGSAGEFLESEALDLLDEGRIIVVRQSSLTPIREIFRSWQRLDPMWTLTLHDDDDWQGTPTLPSSTDMGVSLYAPTVQVCEGGKVVRVAHKWTSQHALFGATSPNLQRAFLEYICPAPMVIGGEDLLLLFMAGQMGQIRVMPDYTYYWNADNWLNGARREETTRNYAMQFSVDGLDHVSAFLLFQSLDRLASCSAMAPLLDRRALRRCVRAAMGTFWPIIDRRGRFIYRASPSFLRKGLLRGRGQRSPARRLLAFAPQDTNREPHRQTGTSHWLSDVDSGVVRLISIDQVLGRLLPELATTVNGDAVAESQVAYWRNRIGSLVIS